MTDWHKVHSGNVRQDSLTRLSKNNWLLIFGYGEDECGGYNLRKYYDHEPSASELKTDINKLVNDCTDEAILSGFVWRDINVWLSMENQYNWKAAYDIAVQTNGATLPIRFKLGERDGNPVYYDFEDMETFTDFYTKAMAYVIACLNEGWLEKDGVDYRKLTNAE